MTATWERSDRSVGVRELQQHASKLLREAQETGPVRVTVQGKPVAVLGPVREPLLLTAEQFDAVVESAPESDHRRYELVRGELIVAPSPVYGHQYLTRLIANALDEVAGQHGLGVVQDWTWIAGPHDVVRPDVMVCSPPDNVRQTALISVPQLVVEVTSTNRSDDLVTKRGLYAASGVPHYWVLDSRDRVLLVHSLEGRSYPDPAVYPGGLISVATFFGDVELDLDALALYLG